MSRLLGIVALLATVGAKPASAEERRYGLFIGANKGGSGDLPLRFAQRDAQRLAETLGDIGGFSPEDVVVLKEPSADQVRSALARLNAKIRSELGRPSSASPASGTKPSGQPSASLLFVFYSGHADALSLHLGTTILPWEELRNVTMGSSATARVLVVDACRSGQATRVKGTELDAPFALPLGDASFPEGFAILSSATAGESAQESDELRSSFFTHHLLAALRGVADADQDGRVTLEEAYQYAAQRTVASTASTLSGVQHPTYQYEIKGRTNLVLTRPATGNHLGAIRLPAPGQYLFWEDSPRGPLALEANVDRKGRLVWVLPGRYFLQRRVPRRLYEGIVQVRAGDTLDVARAALNAVEYAQLTRKGATMSRARAVAAWAGFETPVLDGFSAPLFARVSVALETRELTWDALLGFSRSALSGAKLDSSLSAFNASLGARRVTDLGRWSFSAGLRAGALYFRQDYVGPRTAPARSSLAPCVDTVVRADVALPAGLFVGVEAALRVSYLREWTGPDESQGRTPAQGTISMGVGTFW